jgi:uncharacterized protein (TIGR02453 family)
MQLPISTFNFLRELRKNNNKKWFLQNRLRYEKLRTGIIGFADELIQIMNEYDQIETPSGIRSLMRINRDIRFSKDKTPYKSYFAGHLRRATGNLRGGYYFHIEPGNTYVLGGFLGPNPADLKRIRDEFATDPDSIHSILEEKIFKNYFGTFLGEKLKTSPKGYTSDLPAINLIRMKQYYLKKKFTDEEALRRGFLLKMTDSYIKMRPLFDYMSLILTTDENGIPFI